MSVDSVNILPQIVLLIKLINFILNYQFIHIVPKLFLYKTTNTKPIENSKLARPKDKKVNDIRFKSSLYIPKITLKVYIVTQILSEYSNIFIKLLLLSKNTTSSNQYKIKK